MKDGFYEFLIDKGYKEYTPSGNPSTAYSYYNAIDTVCGNEKLSRSQLSARIDEILPKYDQGGIFEDIGKRSNRKVINALRRFAEFSKN